MAAWRGGRLPTAVLWMVAFWLTASPNDLASQDIPDSNGLVAVPVQDGIATFDLATGSSRDQFLILVSSLSIGAGPYQVELSIRPNDNPDSLVCKRPEPDVNWLARNRRRRKQLDESRQVIRLAEAQTNLTTPARERTFWIMVRGSDFTQTKNYEQVQARLFATGEQCAVYVDVECTKDDRLKSLVDDTIATFDRDVQPAAARKLGRHRDVDGDGKFAILFTPWLGKLADGGVSLGGFVRGSDFYTEIEPPLGNRCDMMYLNSALWPGPHLRTLIAHEYTHAVTLSEHVFGRHLPDRAGQEEESWLDESLAHLAENLHGYSWSNLDYRISGFLNAPERYRLVVEDYFEADLWRGHGNRGSTYLFLRWCVDQFGDGVLRDLVQTNLCGVESVELATGRPFAELYRDWSAAMFLSHSGLATRPENELRFVNLRSKLSDHLLAGPRHEFLNMNGETKRFALAGTSTKYFVAHSPVGAGSRVRVVAGSESNLQVSVLKLPQNLARLELKATPIGSASPNSQAAGIRLELTEHNGIPVRLEHFAWERSARGSNKNADRGACGKIHSPPEIESLFGSAILTGSSTLVASSATLDSLPATEFPAVLKLTGRDAAGHAVTAWCTLESASNLSRTAANAGTDSVVR